MLESGEVRLYDRYYNMPDLQRRDPDPSITQTEGMDQIRLSFWKKIEYRWFTKTELNYAFFLKNNLLTESLVDAWYTMLFRVFGKISDLTPVYSLDPPFLFNRPQVVKNRPSGYFYYHSDSLIARIADNIKAISDSLSHMYNLELVFMPVPNAFTIHHDLVTDYPYDNYLPRLCTALEERGVHTIRLYETFKDPPEFIYHPSDTHLNELGVSMMLDVMVARLEELLPIVDASLSEIQQ